MVTGLCLSRRTVLCTYHAHFCSQPGSSFCISVQERYFLFAHLPPRCTSMSLDLELAKILDEFAVPEAFRTKLLDSACLKVWQFAEYVDDVNDWTSILSSLEPPIVDRMHRVGPTCIQSSMCERRRASIQAKIWTHESSQTEAHLIEGILPFPASIVASAIRYAPRQVGP